MDTGARLSHAGGCGRSEYSAARRRTRRPEDGVA
jgi:hypothetical protein